MKLAIVIPWFGRELKVGAEQHAWQIATRLAQRGHDLDVVTTCCRSHQDDWSINHLPSGITEEPGDSQSGGSKWISLLRDYLVGGFL